VKRTVVYPNFVCLTKQEKMHKNFRIIMKGSG
jgi:hypothetical protein